MDWSQILAHPSTGLVTGRRRRGKTALGMYLLETLSKTHGIPAYSMGLPREKWHLLPPEIKGLEFGEDLPESSVIFIDEAAMAFYARRSPAELNKQMNIMLTVSGQKDQILIYASHTARKLDVGIVLDMDALIFKEPSKLYARFERQEVREMVQHARGAFEGIPPNERVKYSVVFSHELEGELMQNPLPSFWNDDLSRGFAGVPLMREEARPLGKPELSEWDREILERILEVEEAKGDNEAFESWGWELVDIGASWPQIQKFIALGLVRPAPYRSRSTKGYRADVGRIKEAIHPRD